MVLAAVAPDPTQVLHYSVPSIVRRHGSPCGSCSGPLHKSCTTAHHPQCDGLVVLAAVAPDPTQVLNYSVPSIVWRHGGPCCSCSGPYTSPALQRTIHSVAAWWSLLQLLRTPTQVLHYSVPSIVRRHGSPCCSCSGPYTSPALQRTIHSVAAW